jgi:replication initiator protein
MHDPDYTQQLPVEAAQRGDRRAAIAELQARVLRRAAESAETRAGAIAQAAAVEEDEEARQTIGFVGRIVVQATLPHRDPKDIVYERTNAHQMTLRLTAVSRWGLPYGSLPRLFMIWITTEAVRTKDTTLHLGRSINEFLARLDLGDQGGKRGDRTRVRSQLNRLLGTAITVTFDDPSVDFLDGVLVAEDKLLWWDPRRPEQLALFGSTIVLSDKFFREITGHAVPLDMAVVRQLRASPMALDIYGWLTYRFSFLREARTIPWEYLRAQFGASYARERDFRRYFTSGLRAVTSSYPQARVEPTKGGLVLRPSPPSVAPVERRALS